MADTEACEEEQHDDEVRVECDDPDVESSEYDDSETDDASTGKSETNRSIGAESDIGRSSIRGSPPKLSAGIDVGTTAPSDENEMRPLPIVKGETLSTPLPLPLPPAKPSLPFDPAGGVSGLLFP